jgi:hypothetical protein
MIVNVWLIFSNSPPPPPSIPSYRFSFSIYVGFVLIFVFMLV